MKLFDTYTRKKIEFKPISNGKVGYYSCGPTVYFSSHMGHATTYIKTDLVKQYLKHWKGFKVKHVQNITDFGHMVGDEDGELDKIMVAMKREGKTSKQIADYYTKEFHDGMKDLKIESPDAEPKATDYVPDMIKFIQKIISRKYAYEKDGTVYFDVSKFKNYGKLSKKKMDKQAGLERAEKDLNKKNPFDFVMWAKHKEGHSHTWDSPWGKGMPGWHIECSVMSRKNLGGDFDLHSGGMDHYFPHHENEIAQNVGALGKVGVNYWVHFGLLTINGEKMAKSKNNFVTITDALKDFSAETIRMWIFASHYRSILDYSEKNLKLAEEKVEKINLFIQRLLEIKESGKAKIKIKSKFEKAMDDDLNTSLALADLFQFMTEMNKKDLNGQDAKEILTFLKKVDKVFKVMSFEQVKVPKEVKELINKREKARKEKDWKTSDKLRDEIKKKGYQLDDSLKGTGVRKL